MKALWAPWRMDYILSDAKEDGCFICPGDDRNQDENRLILYTGSMTIVLMNKYPYINGHLLVAPIRHIPDLEGLTNEESLDLLLMVRRSIDILKKEMGPEGFNVGLNLGRVAGAGFVRRRRQAGQGAALCQSEDWSVHDRPRRLQTYGGCR